jgi:hypothetical protein
MMTAYPMATTPAKELAAARGKLAHLERTIATELPQELSRLPGPGGFSDLSSLPKTVKSAARGGGRKKAGCAVITTPGFTDDDHPTILADPRGWIQRS